MAVIPARKGSKRVPEKNKRLLYGKPLIEWTIETALQCKWIDEFLVTSDDWELVDIVDKYEKVQFIPRPSELAQDDTPMWEVIEHCCRDYNMNTQIILLQPTSPLRLATDIDNAYAMFKKGAYMYGVVGGYWEFPMSEIELNGSIFIHWLSSITMAHSFLFKGTILYLMPWERSLDIDTEEDWDNAEKWMEDRFEK